MEMVEWIDTLLGFDFTYINNIYRLRIFNISNAVLITVGFVMLIALLWNLQALTNGLMKLVVITVFVLVLLMALSFIMVKKSFGALGLLGT